MTIGETRLEAKRELLLAFVERQMEAGKWLLSSLLLVNGGAIVALLSNEKFGAAVLEVSGLYFVCGVIAAFFAGAGSWMVSNTLIIGLRYQLDVLFYRNEEKFDPPMAVLDAIGQLVMLIASTASLGLFSYGAYMATQKLGGALN